MGTSTRKAQVVLSADQFALVERYAREEGKPVSAFLRESLERTLLPALERRRREEAFNRLTNQNLPVADWEDMERQLESRWNGHDAG